MALKSITEYCEDCALTDIPDDRTAINLILQALCQIANQTVEVSVGDISIAAVSKTASTADLDMTADNDDEEVAVATSASIAVQIIGMTDGLITPEGSIDAGTTWPATPLIGKDKNGALIEGITADGIYFFNVATLNRFRLRVDTVGTGTVTVKFLVSSVPLE